jgi:rare lipoprotein A
MKRKRLLLAVIAACKVLVLSSFPGDASRWDSGHHQVGWASWYGKRFHGRETASGERFSMMELTAAHRSLPLGTKVLVTNLETDELVEVKINDRGPLLRRRIIDLSRAAADSIGLLQRGVGRVQVVVSEEALELQDSDEEVFYEVQAGAFVEIEQANELEAQLRDRYPEAYVVARDGPLGRYYRVRVGPFDTRQEAQQIVRTLTREGYYVFLDEVASSSILARRLHQVGEEEQSDTGPHSYHVEDSVAFRLEFGR